MQTTDVLVVAVTEYALAHRMVVDRDVDISFYNAFCALICYHAKRWRMEIDDTVGDGSVRRLYHAVGDQCTVELLVYGGSRESTLLLFECGVAREFWQHMVAAIACYEWLDVPMCVQRAFAVCARMPSPLLRISYTNTTYAWIMYVYNERIVICEYVCAQRTSLPAAAATRNVDIDDQLRTFCDDNVAAMVRAAESRSGDFFAPTHVRGTPADVQRLYEYVLCGVYDAQKVMNGSSSSVALPSSNDELAKRALPAHAAVDLYHTACIVFKLLASTSVAQRGVSYARQRIQQLHATDEQRELLSIATSDLFHSQALLYNFHVRPWRERAQTTFVPCRVTAGGARAAQFAASVDMPMQMRAVAELSRRHTDDNQSLVVSVELEFSTTSSVSNADVAASVRRALPWAREGVDFVLVWSPACVDRFVVLLATKHWHLMTYAYVPYALLRRSYHAVGEPNRGDALARTFDAYAGHQIGIRSMAHALRTLALLLQLPYVTSDVFSDDAALAAVRRLVRVLHVYASNMDELVTCLFNGYRNNRLSPLWTVLGTVLAPRADNVFITMPANARSHRWPEWMPSHIWTSCFAAVNDHGDARAERDYDFVRQLNDHFDVDSPHPLLSQTLPLTNGTVDEQQQHTRKRRRTHQAKFQCVGVYGEPASASATGHVTSYGEHAQLRAVGRSVVRDASVALHLNLVDTILRDSPDPRKLLHCVRVCPREEPLNAHVYRVPRAIGAPTRWTRPSQPTPRAAPSLDVHALTLGNFVRALTCVGDVCGAHRGASDVLDRAKRAVSVLLDAAAPNYGADLFALSKAELVPSYQARFEPPDAEARPFCDAQPFFVEGALANIAFLCR